MSYPVAIDQTPALASGDGCDSRAPAIAANENFANQVEAASLELDTRKRLRVEENNVVAAAEVKESRRRLDALKTTEAQVAHGMGNAAILAAVNTLGHRLDGLAGRLDNMRAVGTSVSCGC